MGLFFSLTLNNTSFKGPEISYCEATLSDTIFKVGIHCSSLVFLAIELNQKLNPTDCSQPVIILVSVSV